MIRTHYQCWFRLDGADRYLIWYTVEDSGYDADGVVLDASGHIPTFRTIEALHHYAAEHEIGLAGEEPRLHDLDCVQDWLNLRGKRSRKHVRRTTVDCNAFLAAWNLFSDVRFSLGQLSGKRLTPHTRRPYNKLFYGCNLPAITPPGKHYEPIWPNYEVAVLRKVLGSGLKLFRCRLKLLPSTNSDV